MVSGGIEISEEELADSSRKTFRDHIRIEILHNTHIFSVVRIALCIKTVHNCDRSNPHLKPARVMTADLLSVSATSLEVAVTPFFLQVLVELIIA